MSRDHYKESAPRGAALGAALAGGAGCGFFFGVAVAALLALLNPAATAALADAATLALVVILFYIVLGAAAGLAAGVGAFLFPAAAAALRARGIGMGAFIALLFFAASGLFRENAAAYTYCVLPSLLAPLKVYSYLLLGAGALILFLIAARGERNAGAAKTVALLCVPLLLLAFPLARRDLGAAAPPAPPPPPVRADTGLKVWVVGMDALDSDVVRPLARAGRAPAFSRMMAEGASGDLATIPPGLSPAIWTSIATGRYPRDHGVSDYEYMTIRGMTTPLRVFPSRTFLTLLTHVGLAHLKPFNGNDWRAPAFWSIAAAAGYRTGVVGWMTSSPPEILNGYAVADFYRYGGKEAALRADAAALTYPPELAVAVKPFILGTDGVRAEAAARLLPANAPPREELFARIYAEGRTYEDISLALLDKDCPDLWVTYFNPIDAYQHLYWGFRPEVKLGSAEDIARYGDVVNRANIWAADFAARILAAADENTVVIVVSDHGFETASPWRRAYYRLWQGREVTGVHDVTPPPAGFVALAGGPVKRGMTLKRSSVMDVAPNVLYLLGLPVGADMPGRVWSEAYEDAFVDAHPLKRTPSYNGLPVKRAAVPADLLPPEERRKLKALGYLQ